MSERLGSVPGLGSIPEDSEGYEMVPLNATTHDPSHPPANRDNDLLHRDIRYCYICGALNDNLRGWTYMRCGYCHRMIRWEDAELFNEEGTSMEHDNGQTLVASTESAAAVHSTPVTTPAGPSQSPEDPFSDPYMSSAVTHDSMIDVINNDENRLAQHVHEPTRHPTPNHTEASTHSNSLNDLIACPIAVFTPRPNRLTAYASSSSSNESKTSVQELVSTANRYIQKFDQKKRREARRINSPCRPSASDQRGSSRQTSPTRNGASQRTPENRTTRYGRMTEHRTTDYYDSETESRSEWSASQHSQRSIQPFESRSIYRTCTITQPKRRSVMSMSSQLPDALDALDTFEDDDNNHNNNNNNNDGDALLMTYRGVTIEFRRNRMRDTERFNGCQRCI